MSGPAKTGDATHTRYWVPMLGSAIRILEGFFDAKAELSLHELSSAAGVGKTSTFRILFTLDKLGYVQRNPSTGKYRLGLRILTAARKAASTDNLLLTARPYLKHLRDEIDETVNLAALRDGRIAYLEIVESLHAFRMVATVGSVVPWHSTGLGKVIAAKMPSPQLRKLLNGYRMTGYTKYTLTSRRAFFAELAKVKKQGYALDNQENELGASCVAVPVLDQDNQPICAISISGPTPRVNNKESKILQALRTVAAAIGHP